MAGCHDEAGGGVRDLHERALTWQPCVLPASQLMVGIHCDFRVFSSPKAHLNLALPRFHTYHAVPALRDLITICRML